jgi:hypothetical protein
MVSANGTSGTERRWALRLSCVLLLEQRMRLRGGGLCGYGPAGRKGEGVYEEKSLDIAAETQ